MLILLAAPVAPGAAQAPTTNYIVGAQDVLTVTVWNEPQLSGKFTVEADGSFTFPLIGRVVAGGVTLRALEAELRTRLADGFLRRPQVSVAVDAYRSQQVFVVGEVRQPGAYPLTGDMRVMEALARAGSVTPAAAATVLVIHASDRSEQTDGPVLPEDVPAEAMRVDLRGLQNGALPDNPRLQDGDTVFVPSADSIYVLGQVRTPGAYPVRQRTTVLQALSLAGGVTDRGAASRARLVRMVDGKRVELRVTMTDEVQPGDTLVVPERFF